MLVAAPPADSVSMRKKSSPRGWHLGNVVQALTQPCFINAVQHIVAAEHPSWEVWKRSVTARK
jgi:hypothetical protein